jgi:hypothetical protein
MPVQPLGFLSLFRIRDGQLCVVYSRWHGPRLESNAAMGFVKTTDANRLGSYPFFVFGMGSFVWSIVAGMGRV